MISEQQLISILKSPSKKGTRGHIVATCPFCESQKKFYINVSSGKWDCKKCKENGNIERFLRKIGQSHLIEGERATELKVLNLNKISIEQPKEYTELNTIRIPLGFTCLDYDDLNPYTQYLRGRGFTRKDFEDTKCGYTDIKSKLLGYVIFPIYKDYALKAYVSRDIINDASFDDDRLRYRNSSSNFAKLLYGYDKLTKETKIIILVEGVFDAIAINRKLGLYEQNEIVCLATFGNKISDDQLILLRKFKGIDSIFLMYDVRDSVEIMKKVGNKLSKIYQYVNVCDLKSGDPDESTPDQIENALVNSVDSVIFKYKKLQVKKKF